MSTWVVQALVFQSSIANPIASVLYCNTKQRELFILGFRRDHHYMMFLLLVLDSINMRRAQKTAFRKVTRLRDHPYITSSFLGCHQIPSPSIVFNHHIWHTPSLTIIKLSYYNHMEQLNKWLRCILGHPLCMKIYWYSPDLKGHQPNCFKSDGKADIKTKKHIVIL